MRRALLLTAVLLAFLIPTPANASDKTIHISATGIPSPANVTVNGGESVTWINDDLVNKHKVCFDGGDVTNGGIAANGGSFTHTFDDPGDNDALVNYQVDCPNGGSGAVTVKATAPATTTTTEATTTTTKPSTTTTSSSTTSTSSTTTTSSSTTTTTTLVSSFSGPISINSGGKSGSSSTLPLLLGAFVVVAGLAGLAYWLWWRSGVPYDEDEGPDWTQEPPPTVQGPHI